MPIYRPKSRVVAAVQFAFDDAIEASSKDEIKDQIAELIGEGNILSVGDDYLIIHREGDKPDLQVDLNDWIIKLDNDDVAILLPEVFSAFFEGVEDPNNILEDFTTEQIYQDSNGLAVQHVLAINDQEVKKGTFYQIQIDTGILPINFQAGAVPDAGVNGTTNEAVLTIVQHRTQILNKDFPCPENEAAIASIGAAIQSFNDRTANRQARGVDGTQQQ